MKLIAKGNTAEIYEYGDNLICKLFYPQYQTDYIEHEFHNATMAWELGIRTPKAHRIIVEGGRQGIIYDQIVGEVLSVKFSEPSEPAYDVWMNRFADFHKQLMQYSIDTLINRLEENEKNDIVYHRQGIVGDYDDFDDVEELIRFIQIGKR